MRLFVFIIIVLGIGFGLLYPMVNTQRMCYVSNQNRYDDINANVLWRSWNERKVCETRMDALFNLESCLQNATKSSDIARYTNTIIQKLVFVFRPSTIGISDLKSEHNRQCAGFTWAILP